MCWSIYDIVVFLGGVCFRGVDLVGVSDCEELVGGQLQEMMEMQLPRVLVFKWKIL